MTLLNWMPAIIALIGAAVTIIGYLLGRKKLDAEASEKISASWERLIKPLEARVSRLERNEAIFRKRERIMLDYIDYLRDTLRSNNIKVGPMPELPSLDVEMDA